MTMGEKMQKLRKQKNWSQETLAEKLGVDQETFLATMNGLKTDNIGNEEVVKRFEITVTE